MTLDLLTPAAVRALAERLDLKPTKALGQNFVVDPGTVRRIAALALKDAATGGDAPPAVVEVGPGLGSLTLALLEAGAAVTAVEIDPKLARALPGTVAERAGEAAARLHVVEADALTVEALPDPQPQILAANLPYNVGVPVILRFWERLPHLRRALVMVQAEVADRLAAGPGSRTYGVPSAKAAWWADVRRAGDVGRSVFWPVPRVDSALVLMERHAPPSTSAARADVFAAVDAAFSQRRKTLRSALAAWAGSADRAEAACRAAGIAPTDRGERLGIAEFARLAEAKAAL